MKNKPFNYVGPINSTGYGVASIGYVNGLTKHNQNISIVPIGQISNQHELSESSKKALENKLDPSAPTFCFWHLFDIPNRIQDCKGPKVAFTTFELETLTKQEQEVLNTVSYIGTASNWGKNVLKQYINENKIFVAPHAFKETENDNINYPVDLSVSYWQDLLNPFKIPSDALYLTTAGKFESRKGYPELIEAALQYSVIKPVVLITFCYNPFIPDGFPYNYFINNSYYPVYTKSGLKAYKKNKLLILLMPPVKTRQDLHLLLAKSHFFISPSKGEGWNLPLFEAMSNKIPCITTLTSAHSEYCTTDNVIPIITQGKEVADDGLFFKGQGIWHKVMPQNILTSIVTAENMNKETIAKMVSNAAETTGKFSWEKSAKIIQTLMNKF